MPRITDWSTGAIITATVVRLDPAPSGLVSELKTGFMRVIFPRRIDTYPINETLHVGREAAVLSLESPGRMAWSVKGW